MFQKHRQRFMKELGSGVAIVPGARTPVGPAPFRQDSFFHYLTGFNEPNAVAVIAPQHPKHPYVLFVQARDRAQEQWTGPRSGTQGAKRVFRADKAFPISKLDKKLQECTEGAQSLHYHLGADQEMDDRILKHYARLCGRKLLGRDSGLNVLVDPHPILARMRLIKDREEIQCIRRASHVTTEALLAAMCAVRPGLLEDELKAVLSERFQFCSCIPAFPSIVASGPNATVLHHETGSRRIQEGDLVLIDAGAEWGRYASDVTRTFPASGRFTPEQKAVYDTVLRARAAALERIGPGEKWGASHRAAVRALTKGLLNLGALKGSVSSLIKERVYSRYYPHNTSHWVGLDVHDPGPSNVSVPEVILEPGMVISVEPGLYFPPWDHKAPHPLRGIGIRIEDTVLITSNGHSILTPMPLDSDEIEHLISTSESNNSP